MNLNYADITIYSVIGLGCLIGFLKIYNWWKEAEEIKNDIRYKMYCNIKDTCKKFKKKGIKKLFIETSKGIEELGKYKGECIDKEGFRNIAFYKSFIDNLFGKFDILRCNISVEHTIKQKKKGELKFKLPITDIKEGNNFYVIKSEGIMKEGYFYYPIMSFKGKIVNDTLHDYLRHREICLTEIMYEQLSDFSKSVRKATIINPQVALQKSFKEEVIPEKK